MKGVRWKAATLQAALDVGLTLIDTADAYGGWNDEPRGDPTGLNFSD